MKIIIILIFSFCIFSCNTMVINHENDALMTSKNIISGNRSAILKFKRKNSHEISLHVLWSENVGKEYTDYGPIELIYIIEDGKRYDIIGEDIHNVEDFDMNSFSLKSERVGEYDLSICYGVGESRNNPQIFHIR